MKHAPVSTAVLVCLLLTHAMAAPEQDSVAAYRAFVKAVREGKVDEAVKLVEPGDGPAKALVRPTVEQFVAIEAMKQAATKRFGPFTDQDRERELGGVLADTYLDTLQALPEPTDPKVMMLIGKNPKDGNEFMCGVMANHQGKWLMHAGFLTMMMPNADQPAPMNAEQMEIQINYMKTFTAAANAVTTKIKSGEVKDHEQVARMFSDESKKAMTP